MHQGLIFSFDRVPVNSVHLLGIAARWRSLESCLHNTVRVCASEPLLETSQVAARWRIFGSCLHSTGHRECARLGLCWTHQTLLPGGDVVKAACTTKAVESVGI